MIELINNNDEVIKDRISSFTVTYQKTDTFFFGHYNKTEILHNLRFKTKQNISEEHSYLTNVKGKRTAWDFFKNDEDFLKMYHEIMSLYRKGSGRSKTILQDAWGNLLGKGDEVVCHDHDCNHGIIYLTEGNPIKFPDCNFQFTPKPGDYLISPLSIKHYVDPIKDEKERISVVFNFSTHSGFNKDSDKTKKS